MNYQYYFGHHFQKQLKPYLKKYRSLAKDIRFALKTFDPRLSIWLGGRAYKIRVKSQDISRGKSHAFRMIVLLIELNNILAPVTLYFKGNRENITNKEIAYHTSMVEHELIGL